MNEKISSLDAIIDAMSSFMVSQIFSYAEKFLTPFELVNLMEM